jgi:hypothetical protein
MRHWHRQFLGRTQLPPTLSALAISEFFTLNSGEARSVLTRYGRGDAKLPDVGEPSHHPPPALARSARSVRLEATSCIPNGFDHKLACGRNEK